MKNEIYHFTDVVRLPWIAAAGELRPGSKQATDHPCAFLWATANPDGDPTASAFCGNGYREGYLTGNLGLVRIALHAEDFLPWSAVPQRFPQWTPEHVHKLEYETRKALGKKVIRDWRARAEPLPLSRAICIEAKRFNEDWRTIDVNRACVSKVVEGKLVRGVVMGDDVLPAKPTKPSKWWMLLLIIPAIATGLAVVASQFQPARWTLFKNFRRRWTNWQARLAGHLDLMGDNITQWSRRASRPVQIDPTGSERPSPSNSPSSSLTTFDPKSLVVN